MTRCILIILLFSFSTVAYSQLKLPAFESSNIAGFETNYWFLRYLSKNYPEHITITEYANKNERSVIGSIAIRHDSAFIITQSYSEKDIPNMRIFVKYISKPYFNQILDSLTVLKAFDLKDQAEIANCFVPKNISSIVSPTSTAANGIETLMILYNRNQYRFSSYYELSNTFNSCPASADFQKAIAVRDYLKYLLLKPLGKREADSH